MHRKKVLAGLFLTAGLALTLLTPRNVRADDVLPGGSAVTADDAMADQGIEDLLLITPEELSVSISPGSPETPAADEDSGERSEQAHSAQETNPVGGAQETDSGGNSAQETDPGADIEQEMDLGGDIAQETGEQGGPDDPADPTDPAQPADPEADPTDPAQPADPDDDQADPANPTDSEQPLNSEDDTAGPIDPEQPANMEQPADHSNAPQTNKKNNSSKPHSQTTSKAPSPAHGNESSSHPTAPQNPSGSGTKIQVGNPQATNRQQRSGRSRLFNAAGVYAVPRGKFPVTIREDMSAGSRAVGRITRGSKALILADKDEKWLYVEFGNIKGYVPRILIRKENGLRAAIIKKAEEYLGGPYVWGGTSLTGGCDCSGFIQSLFGLFGIKLPRTSREQANAGQPIALSEVLPGDLVFYETDGVVSHVMMAIGGGKAINAANSRAGIIISDIDMSRAVRACRVLGADEDSRARRVLGADEESRTSHLHEASHGCLDAVDGAAYTQDQLELIWAIVAQEDDTCYEGALAVISCAMNRADLNYGGYGMTALDQLTADGQFCYSPKISDPSYWMRRLGGRVPEFVKTAVSDCLTQGIRNNSYLNFRSGNRNGISVQIGGNWFF